MPGNSTSQEEQNGANFSSVALSISTFHSPSSILVKTPYYSPWFLARISNFDFRNKECHAIVHSRGTEWCKFQLCSTFHFGVKGPQRMTSISIKTAYSGTSVSGPSQQRPTSLQRPKRRVRIDFSIDLTHFEPPNNGNGNLQTPASGQRPGSGTLDFRRKLPPRTAKCKTTPLFVKPHPLFVRRIHCNIHPYKGHLSTRAKRSDPKVALLRRFHCITVHGFWPESENFDFHKKECQAIVHLKGNRMVQISAL